MRCEIMNVLHFNELGEDIRASLQGQRWLVLRGSEIPLATAALAFSELEDVLVAVDHRGSPVEEGVWMRAVHLLVVDASEKTNQLQARTGITKVVETTGELLDLLW